jgi:hypothetical protein
VGLRIGSARLRAEKDEVRCPRWRRCGYGTRERVREVGSKVEKLEDMNVGAYKDGKLDYKMRGKQVSIQRVMTVNR